MQSASLVLSAEGVSSPSKRYFEARTLDQSEAAFERSLSSIRNRTVVEDLQEENARAASAAPVPSAKIADALTLESTFASGAELQSSEPQTLEAQTLEMQPAEAPVTAPQLHAWYASVQSQSPLALVETYPNDPNIVDQGFTYSQATAGKVMLHEGNLAGAKKIFDSLYWSWDGQGFYTVYNTQNSAGPKIEYVRRMGESALAALFSLHYWKTTGDARALDLATKVGKWITFLPHQDGGVAMGADSFWGNIYSVENNLDYYALTKVLAVSAASSTDKGLFTNERDRLKNWLKTKAYDPASGLFRRSPSDSSVVHALDSNTWGILAIGVSTLQNEFGINVDQLIARTEQKFAVQNDGSFGGAVTAAKGFDFSDQWNAQNAGRSGIKWVEGTAEMISVYREMHRYYTQDAPNAQQAEFYRQRAEYFTSRLSENAVQTDTTLSYTYTDRAGAKVWYDNPYWYASSGPAADSTAWAYFAEQGINFFVPDASKRRQPAGYPIVVTSNGGTLPKKANAPFTVTYKEGEDGAQKSITFAFPAEPVEGQGYTFTIPNERTDAQGSTGQPLEFNVVYDTTGYPIVIVSNNGTLPVRANGPFTVRYKEGADGAEKNIPFSFPTGPVDGQSYSFTIPNTRADEIGNVDPDLTFSVIYDVTGYPIVLTVPPPAAASGPFEVRYKEGQDGPEKAQTFQFPSGAANGQVYSFTIDSTRADEIGNISPDYTFTVRYEAVQTPAGQPIHAWYAAVQAQSPIGLVETYPNDPNLVDQAFTYSQATAGHVMLKEGNLAGAKKIFDFYNARWDGQGFYTVYNSQSVNGQKIEYVRRMGESALIAMFSLNYWKKTGDARALDLATKVGKWITFLPHRDGGVAMGSDSFWGGIYSVENNLDYYALTKALATSAVKASDRSMFTNERNRLKTWFRTKAYDQASGLFRRATSDTQVVHALDSNSWAILSLGVATLQNEFGINVDQMIARAEQKFLVQNDGSFGGDVFTGKGFDFSDQWNAQNSGRTGIKWVEGTAEMIAAYRELQRYYTQDRPDAVKAAFYARRAEHFSVRLNENAIENGSTLSYSYTDRAGAKVWFDNPHWFANSGPAADSTAWVYFSQNGVNPFNVQ